MRVLGKRFIHFFVISGFFALASCGGGGGSGGAADTDVPPTLFRISPTRISALGPGFKLTVDGKGFDSSSTVMWNNSTLPTTYLSPTELQADVPASDTATAVSPVTITVYDSRTHLSTSNAQLLGIIPPVPTLASVNPSLVLAGSQNVKLDITGNDFLDGAVLLWGNVSLNDTKVLSLTHLQVQIPDYLIATPGATPVAIAYAGGIKSNALTFTYEQQPPTIIHLSPNAIQTGALDFALTISGRNFDPKDVVKWNDTSLHTIFISANELQATVPAALSANPTTAAINVAYTGAGGGESGASPFSVTTVAPLNMKLDPGAAIRGGAAFVLTIVGSGFTPASVVSWNGKSLITSYVSANQLQVTVPPSNITALGTDMVTVTTGITTSSPLSFLVGQDGGVDYAYIDLSQAVNDVVWDSKNYVFYMTVPSSYPNPSGGSIVPANHDSLLVYDPIKARITNTLASGIKQNRLGISDDEQFLYVDQYASGAVQRYQLPALTPDINCSLGVDPSFGAYSTLDLRVAPGSPHTMAVSLTTAIGIPGGAVIMDDCVTRPNKVPRTGPLGVPDLISTILWKEDASEIYAEAGGSLYVLSVDTNGVSVLSNFQNVVRGNVFYDAGTKLLYTDAGFIINPSMGKVSGWFVDPTYGVHVGLVTDPSFEETAQMDFGTMIPDSTVGAAFFAYASGLLPLFTDCLGIEAYDMNNHKALRGLILQSSLDTLAQPTHVISWGSNGLLVISAEHVYLIAGTFVSGQ